MFKTFQSHRLNPNLGNSLKVFYKLCDRTDELLKEIAWIPAAFVRSLLAIFLVSHKIWLLATRIDQWL